MVLLSQKSAFIQACASRKVHPYVANDQVMNSCSCILLLVKLYGYIKKDLNFIATQNKMQGKIFYTM